MKLERLCTNKENPTHGRSEWIIQILSTEKSGNVSAQSHQRQLVVGSDPLYKMAYVSPPARCARSVKWTHSQ